MTFSISSFYPKTYDGVLGNERTHTHTSMQVLIDFCNSQPTNCLFFLFSYSCLIFSWKNRNKSCRHAYSTIISGQIAFQQQHIPTFVYRRKNIYLHNKKKGRRTVILKNGWSGFNKINALFEKYWFKQCKAIHRYSFQYEW